MDNLSRNIFRIRRINGLSQDDFGERVGVTRQTISRWELGETSPKSIRIEKICREFGINSNELFQECINQRGNDNVIIDREEIKRNLRAINKARAEKSESKVSGSEDEIDNEIIQENNVEEQKANSTIPVAKRIEKFKKLMKIFKKVLIGIIIAYLLYCIYRFSIMLYITKGVERYKNLNNYYCEIREYGSSDINSITKIWYKDGIYKIIERVTSNNNSIIYVHWINLNTKERIEYDAQTTQLDIFNEDSDPINIKNKYIDGQYMYNSFPDCIKFNLQKLFLFSIRLNKTYLKVNEKTITLHCGEAKIQFDKNELLPISYSEINNSNISKVEGIKYYDLKSNETTNYDVSRENIKAY